MRSRRAVRAQARAFARGAVRSGGAAVPADAGRSNLCVAIQAPVMRLSIEQALEFLPALQRAAEALGRIDAPPSNSPKAQR